MESLSDIDRVRIRDFGQGRPWASVPSAGRHLPSRQSLGQLWVPSCDRYLLSIIPNLRIEYSLVLGGFWPSGPFYARFLREVRAIGPVSNNFLTGSAAIFRHPTAGNSSILIRQIREKTQSWPIFVVTKLDRALGRFFQERPLRAPNASREPASSIPFLVEFHSTPAGIIVQQRTLNSVSTDFRHWLFPGPLLGRAAGMWLAVGIAWCVMMVSATGQTVREQIDPSRLELPDAIVTSQTSFDIPFNVDDQDGRLIEVQLYVSTDLGKTWSLYARQSPQKRKIPFQSVGDGEYLFALKTLDRDRRLTPTGPPFPTLRIAVDTQQPELQLRIDPDKDGRIAATWRANDANLNRQSVQLFYRIAAPDAPADWIAVPTGNPSEQDLASPAIHQDRVVWWPDTTANAIVVKAEVKDHAGNVATVFQPVGLAAFRPRPALNPGMTGQSISPPDPSLTGQAANQAYKPNLSSKTRPVSGPIQWPADRPEAEEPTGNLAFQTTGTPSTLPKLADTHGSAPDPFRALLNRKESTAQDLAAGNMNITQGTTLKSGPPASEATASLPNRSQFIPQSALASQRTQNSIDDRHRRAANPVSEPGSSTQFASHRPAGTTSNQPETNRTDSVPNRNSSLDDAPHQSAAVSENLNSPFQFTPGTHFVVNQKQFRLRYHVDGLQPDQIGSVAIFGSRDMGQTWELWTTDRDKISPVDIEIKDEGRYAFRVVITNLGGLASQIPDPGTAPELVVDVDLTSPIPQITAAPYGKDPTSASLVIQWRCPDRDLSDDPIAIAYSDSPSGPWTTITRGTANSGEYVWKLQPNLPKRVFIRMAATDRAGNRGFHQLPNPINLAPLIPSGRILGIEK